MCCVIVKDDRPFDFEKEEVGAKCENDLKKSPSPTRKEFANEATMRHCVETKYIEKLKTIMPFSSLSNGYM